MTAPADQIGTDEGSGRPRPQRPMLNRAWRVAVGLVVAASFGIWVYGFSGAADRDPPDLLDDDAFPASAERVCAAALADLDQLPGALDATDGPDRAGQVEASTDRLASMLDQLDELVSGSARDIEITRGWLSDWRVLVADRYEYADRVAQDPSAAFLITDTGAGERLDRRVTRVANTNAMPSCGAPGDVG